MKKSLNVGTYIYPTPVWVVGSYDDKLYAIHSENTGLANSPWPKFGHDNSNSGNSLIYTSAEKQEVNDLTEKFSLDPLYPNPFNPSTNIKFSLPTTSNVEITVYNVAGQLIGKLLDEEKNPGSYIINWNATNRASGMYLIRIKANDFVQTKKCVLLK